MSVRYETVTAMRAAATSGFSTVTAQTAFVVSLNDFFKFVRGSAATPVANIIVPSSDGLGSWHRMGIPPQVGAGGLLVYDANGNASAYTPGATTGQVFTSNGAGVPGTWQPIGSTKYLGNVGQRTYVPSSAGGTLLNMMSLSMHKVTDDVAAVQFAIPNWQGTNEAGPGAASVVKVSIQFPDGTLVPILVSGSTSVSIPDGGMIWTDPFPWTIARNTWFGIRIYRTNAVGCPYTANVQDHALGERIEYNAGVDKTLSGTISATETAPWAGPCGIRGLMTRPSVTLIGDSRVAGEGDTPNGTGAIGEYARSLQAAGLAWQNLAIGGTGANGFLSGSHTHRIALASLCSHMITEYGINDLLLGDAQMRADLNSINALLPAAQKKYVGTMAPRTTSSDGWATVANQTVTAQESTLLANNNWRRTIPTGFIGCFDVNAILQSGITGKWLAPGYTADGLHGSATAYAAILNSGIITAANFTL